ncbi:hypothetical protein BHM03_00038413 [Ensete ventricosum]|nr:hypothetical protein BHM03_00038413 [Ensete ventricosum]
MNRIFIDPKWFQNESQKFKSLRFRDTGGTTVGTRRYHRQTKPKNLGSGGATTRNRRYYHRLAVVPSVETRKKYSMAFRTLGGTIA